MVATISADIGSSTSLSVEDVTGLKARIEDIFRILGERIVGFWGRLIKGDYLECFIPSAGDALRAALIIKCGIKSFKFSEEGEKSLFRNYGARISIGIGNMRIVDMGRGILDGEAIYLSGRALAGMGSPTKSGTLLIETTDNEYRQTLYVVGILLDALLNKATPRQCEVLFYKLLGKNEHEIARILGVIQSAVNQHSTASNWRCIEETLRYFEHLNFKL